MKRHCTAAGKVKKNVAVGKKGEEEEEGLFALQMSAPTQTGGHYDPSANCV